ncbi:MAG: hypothetical protein ACYC0V_20585 [Armatimonadota bacterium]
MVGTGFAFISLLYRKNPSNHFIISLIRQFLPKYLYHSNLR